MAASARARIPARRESGYTLIELVVVLTVVGIATAAVLLALPQRSVQERLADDAQDIAAAVEHLKRIAILARRPAALALNDAGYSALLYEDGAWIPVARTGWRATRAYSGPWTAQWLSPASGVADGPRIVLLPDGTLSAFALRLAASDGGAWVEMRAAGGSEVSIHDGPR